jgi:arsenate reductase (thioredoxin)
VSGRILGSVGARVLFVCVHNAGRSVMAEALFNRAAGGRATAVSAGTIPSDGPHPEVIAVMREVGLDVASHRGRPLSDGMVVVADRVITMGCAVDESACPAIRYRDLEDWGLPDPNGQPLERVREIRDEIDRRVRALVSVIVAGDG